MQEVLTCTHCMGTDGNHHESTIAVGSCNDAQVIGNSDGALTCEDPSTEPDTASESAGRRLEDLPAHADDVPDGSYQQTCGGCKIADSQLICECLNGLGELIESQYPLTDLSESCAAEDLQNIDGTVTCVQKIKEEDPKQDL